MEKSTLSILLVEDNPGDTGLIKAYLADEQSQQYVITTARRLDEALSQLEAQAFDVILLDLNLPDSYGLATLNMLMAVAATVPVIVITGLDDITLGVEAVRLGAQDYLVKGELQTSVIVRSIRYARERVATKRELSERETDYRLLAENITDMIVRHAPDSTIRYVSPSCFMLLGYNTEEMVGLKTDAFFHPDDLHILNEVRTQSRQHLDTYTITYRARHKEGKYCWFETRGNVIRDPTTHRVTETISVSRDVTERMQANEELNQYSRRLTLLHEVDRAILNGLSPVFVAELIAKSLVEATDCDAIRIIKVDSSGHAFSYMAAAPPVDRQSADLLRQTIEQFGIPDALCRGTGQLINDIQTHTTMWPGYKEVLTRHKARSWMIVPMIAMDELIGLIAATSVHPSAFTSGHFEIAQEVANQLAIALHRAQLDEQIQEHTRTLEVRVAERTKELHLAKERIEAILRSTSDAICVVQMDGRIEQVNPAFTKLFGDVPSPFRSLSLFSRIDTVSISALRDALSVVVDGAKIMRAELIGLRADGTHFHADIALAPLDGGERRLVICSIRDVSLYRQAEESLRAALAYEKELNELQGSFTTIVSHEFRTPLAVILSSTEILLNYSDRLDEERRKEKLINITRQIKRLMHLLNDVLLITRGEHRGFEFNPGPVQLDALFSQTIDEVIIGYEKEIYIDAVHHGDCQLVNIDEFLFGHILQNLTTNAIKYSYEGGTVRVTLACSHTSVTLEVKDYGIGIPEKLKGELFEPFRRGSNVGQIQGTGIGLSIVKRAVEAHGGTIGFESTEGVGTTFVVHLPVSS